MDQEWEYNVYFVLFTDALRTSANSSLDRPSLPRM